jgi:hypothetical protein
MFAVDKLRNSVVDLKTGLWPYMSRASQLRHHSFLLYEDYMYVPYRTLGATFDRK